MNGALSGRIIRKERICTKKKGKYNMWHTQDKSQPNKLNHNEQLKQ